MKWRENGNAQLLRNQFHQKRIFFFTTISCAESIAVLVFLSQKKKIKRFFHTWCTHFGTGSLRYIRKFLFSAEIFQFFFPLKLPINLTYWSQYMRVNPVTWVSKCFGLFFFAEDFASQRELKKNIFLVLFFSANYLFKKI